MDGTYLDPAPLIVEGLTRRFGEFDEEIANQAKRMLRNFRAHPGETLMDVLTRYDCCLQKVAMEQGAFPMSKTAPTSFSAFFSLHERFFAKS